MSTGSGWPSNEHGVFTPMGEVEQTGNFVRGLRSGRHPVAKAVVVAVLVPLFVVVPVTALVAALL